MHLYLVGIVLPTSSPYAPLAQIGIDGLLVCMCGSRSTITVEE